MLSRYAIPILLSVFVISCGQDPTPAQQQGKQPVTDTVVKKNKTDSMGTVAVLQQFSYHFEHKAIWKQKDSFEGYNHKMVLAAINRVDQAHLQQLDSFLVPDHYTDSVAAYMPFPPYTALLKDIRKIIIFSYPAQVFAAYENGKLILTGPTNMGKKASPTPQGLFFCNWKSKEIRSTVNNEWILKWNFNVSNAGGVGFHQYALPGYPASHSCMRLWASQAQFLYSWAEQWKLNPEGKLLTQGTPVIVYGTYPFGQPRPWFALAANGKALDINDSLIGAIVEPHRNRILEAQAKKDSVAVATPASL